MRDRLGLSRQPPRAVSVDSQTEGSNSTGGDTRPTAGVVATQSIDSLDRSVLRTRLGSVSQTFSPSRVFRNEKHMAFTQSDRRELNEIKQSIVTLEERHDIHSELVQMNALLKQLVHQGGADHDAEVKAIAADIKQSTEAIFNDGATLPQS